MSMIAINPINRQEIIHTEEEYGKAYIESCQRYRPFENAVDASDEDQRDLVKQVIAVPNWAQLIQNLATTFPNRG